MRNPATAINAQLDAVSCTSGRRCIAVGFYADLPGLVNIHGRSFALAERWNGRKWRIQRTPRPAGSTDMVFTGVSCTSARACTAVGSTGAGTLAERWNGRRWGIQHIASPAAGFLTAVSCTSATFCMAVGGDNAGGALAERWNGRRWAVRASVPGDSGLQAVSCTSARACTAVGFSGIERWNGATWASQRSPQIRGTLAAVSCASAHACTAVGQGFRGTSQPVEVAVAEHWNGRKWVIQRTPNPRRRSFAGASCTSAHVCTAVGFRQRLFTVRTLAERHS
jgi:hypothetical protein